MNKYNGEGFFNFQSEADESATGLVSRLIEYAYAAGASDVHIDPGETEIRLRLRIDGLLKPSGELSLILHSEILNRLKVLAGLRTDEHRLPQDGRFTHKFSGVALDVRISVAPTYFGENAVLRLLGSSQNNYSLTELGLSESSLDAVKEAINKSHGLILVAGPTGSGKTTTLYSFLKSLNRPEVSIVTIEDPIEYSFPGVKQIQVNEITGLSFARGLRSILRQDPDIIVVGEIRDKETAVIAVNAALTGHLVLSSIHATDAASALPRLLDMGVENYLLASTARLVIAQRLVRKLCVACQGKSCQECFDLGYKDRVGIYELIKVSPTIQEAIGNKLSSARIRELAIKEGMTELMHEGLEKVNSGLTSHSEVLRVLSN